MALRVAFPTELDGLYLARCSCSVVAGVMLSGCVSKDIYDSG